MGEDDPPSLEYIEDPYFPRLANGATPSLDEVTEFDHRSLFGDEDTCEWSRETELYLRSLTLDQLLGVPDDELQTVEAEFVPASRARRIRLLTKRKLRDVKVTFIDFSKPYLARISSNENYKKFLHFGDADNSAKLSDVSPGSVGSAVDVVDELAGLSLEEQERQKAEWSQELSRVEEEITTLRTVLASKVRHSSELKRKLGITVWKEITDDMNQGIKNVKESNVYQTVEEKVGNFTKAVQDAPIYQKTENVFKSTAEKTSSLFGGLSTKISQMKNSESFKSFEERVGSAYENVKTKVSNSRSNSVHSFSDYHEDSRTSTAPQSPTIPEEKPLK
ncbi:tumor protein D54 isoform X2 [Phlebotomus argentipes]|uniref:tumor protein D54 isoform X2 n=1 Tax=Phlebotomus argentipes TaxID=94469 RepID=UPI002892C861|nr:tumor protein D54 isoform X2 [Phlebotomus argentipes]